MALGRKPVKEQDDNKTVEISAQMAGSLKFEDPVNLKINGNFNGSLSTKGTLTIGEIAKVEANIEGDNIIVAGKITGNITAHIMLVLMPTASLIGDIKTPKLNIVEGALFQGQCSMENMQPPTTIPGNLLRMDEVAKYLEIDRHEIEQLANSGKIPAIRAGDTWEFERSKIDLWASTGRVD